MSRRGSRRAAEPSGPAIRTNRPGPNRSAARPSSPGSAKPSGAQSASQARAPASSSTGCGPPDSPVQPAPWASTRAARRPWTTQRVTSATTRSAPVRHPGTVRQRIHRAPGRPLPRRCLASPNPTSGERSRAAGRAATPLRSSITSPQARRPPTARSRRTVRSEPGRSVEARSVRGGVGAVENVPDIMPRAGAFAAYPSAARPVPARGGLRPPKPSQRPRARHPPCALMCSTTSSNFLAGEKSTYSQSSSATGACPGDQ